MPNEFPTITRDALDEAALDVNASEWGELIPFAIVDGHMIEPYPQPGYLLVDGVCEYSAAWL